jgi:multimeric flavodoxin WrbA
MRITILNGSADAQNKSFDDHLHRLTDTLITRQHQVTTLTLRAMEIKQCVGCWGCWVKTPGECVIADDSHQVCRAVINADFVLFASPMVMGFPSALLKRTMDRLIPLVHPYIVVDQGEAHHLARYANYPRLGLLLEKSDGVDGQDIQITSEVFSRTALNLKTRLAFTKLTTDSVETVAQAIANAGHQSSQPPSEPSTVVVGLKRSTGLVPSRLTVLNGSPRGKTGNTQVLLERLVQGFEANAGRTHEMLHLIRVREAGRLRQAFTEAECVLLGFPLYTDAMPGLVKAFIEALQPLCGRARNPALGFLVQSGFPEAAHSRYVEKYLEKLALRLGSPYVGTLVKGGAEGVRFIPPDANPPLFDTLHQLGEAFGKTGQFDSTLVRQLAKPERFPRVLAPAYKLMLRTKAATSYWDNQLEENGAYENRFAQPYVN